MICKHQRVRLSVLSARFRIHFRKMWNVLIVNLIPAKYGHDNSRAYTKARHSRCFFIVFSFCVCQRPWLIAYWFSSSVLFLLKYYASGANGKLSMFRVIWSVLFCNMSTNCNSCASIGVFIDWVSSSFRLPNLVGCPLRTFLLSAAANLSHKFWEESSENGT